MNTTRPPFSTASPLARSSPPTQQRIGPGTGSRSRAAAPRRARLRPAVAAAAARRSRSVGRGLRTVALAALCAAAVATTPPARAETNLYNLLGGWSKHFGTDADDLNETHWGVGLEIEHEVGAWTVGGTVLNFSNSYSERSTYIGPVGKRCFEPVDDWRACLGVTAGIMNGYDARNDGGFAPIASAVADLSYRAVGAGFVCGPTLEFNGVCLALVRIRLPVPKRF
jgi:hypothetical protein